jgi:hypothetical protein
MAALEKPPFSSRCPTCQELRVMDRYSRSDLQRRLEALEAIQGWCQPCDKTWNFTQLERDMIAKGLAEEI